jgi:prevent-host-death family protein
MSWRTVATALETSFFHRRTGKGRPGAHDEESDITEAKNHLSALIDRVKGGAHVLIVDRRRPVARLEPVSGSAFDHHGSRLARLVRDGLVRPARAAVPKVGRVCLCHRLSRTRRRARRTGGDAGFQPAPAAGQRVARRGAERRNPGGSRRFLRVHPLRAADALQLAAAFVAAEGRPSSLEVVTLDGRLGADARKEGFVLTDVRSNESAEDTSRQTLERLGPPHATNGSNEGFRSLANLMRSGWA